MGHGHIDVVIQGANIRHGPVRVRIAGIPGIDQCRRGLEIIIARVGVHKNRVLADVIIDVRGGAVIILADHRTNGRRQGGAGIGHRCVPGVVIVNIENTPNDVEFALLDLIDDGVLNILDVVSLVNMIVGDNLARGIPASNATLFYGNGIFSYAN